MDRMDAGSGFFAALLQQTSEAIAVIGEGRVVFVNDAAATLLGTTTDVLLGADIVGLVHPDDLHRAATVLAGLGEGARPRPGLIKVRMHDGSWQLFEISASPIITGDGGPPLSMLLLRDNAWHETHWNFLAALSGGERFEDCVEMLARGLSEGPDGPLAINYATHARCDVGDDKVAPVRRDGEPEPRTLAGRLPRALGAINVDGSLDLTPGAPWTIALETGQHAWAPIADLPADVRAAASVLGLAACVAVPVPDPGHELPALMLQWPPWTTMAGLLGEALIRRPYQALSLALERRFAMNRLEQLAHHDGLTGLLNRERFFDALPQMDARAAPYTVFYIDLDRFKPVNDTLGHLIGDQVIAACARRLLHVSRPTDVVARLGGDEFAVACPQMDDIEAESMAARIVEALSDPIRLSTHVVEIGASVGCSVWAPGRTADSLVAYADAALYAAKRAGRNRWARH
jgi:diguanylate cyclase (GGDEF)-like protein/PAS domain S-box-containing protein